MRLQNSGRVNRSVPVQLPGLLTSVLLNVYLDIQAPQHGKAYPLDTQGRTQGMREAASGACSNYDSLLKTARTGIHYCSKGLRVQGSRFAS